MTIRRVSYDKKTLRQIGHKGAGKVTDVPPIGISPMLRASWNFAGKMARRFNEELMHEQKDRVSQFLKNLVKKFV
ncbi:MAG: hypothetical protein ABIH69_06760 [bacterium]